MARTGEFAARAVGLIFKRGYSTGFYYLIILELAEVCFEKYYLPFLPPRSVFHSYLLIIIIHKTRFLPFMHSHEGMTAFLFSTVKVRDWQSVDSGPYYSNQKCTYYAPMHSVMHHPIYGRYEVTCLPSNLVPFALPS